LFLKDSALSDKLDKTPCGSAVPMVLPAVFHEA
jgi:hypothetical protein